MKTSLLTITLCLMVTACSMFGTTNENKVATIPMPPQKVNESDAVMPIIPEHKPSPNQIESLIPQKNKVINQGRIVETRGPGGSVNNIKVNNSGKLPAYYISPNNQGNNDSQSGNNVAPATWKINW